MKLVGWVWYQLKHHHISPLCVAKICVSVFKEGYGLLIALRMYVPSRISVSNALLYNTRYVVMVKSLEGYRWYQPIIGTRGM